ncbi:hypothetical protein SAMN04489716_1871 [Actinoplanes derwentensis]|uniref:Uncharacterized protein n=1 Tax=Actinoplanes derwentensis TaxID=113562 RepID=A0A1H1VSR2_9ACTN|nr:hypothetical protein SAMN04489716_1871 [Actinoplanes derwentensis]
MPVGRLTLAGRVEAGDRAVELARPVFLRAGETIQVDGDFVRVRGADGSVMSYPGEGFWLC